MHIYIRNIYTITKQLGEFPRMLMTGSSCLYNIQFHRHPIFARYISFSFSVSNNAFFVSPLRLYLSFTPYEHPTVTLLHLYTLHIYTDCTFFFCFVLRLSAYTQFVSNRTHRNKRHTLLFLITVH